MASTVRRKRARSRATLSSRHVKDMTADELRAMIEKLIDRKLEKLGADPTRAIENKITPQMRQRALSAAGRFRSGHSDISTKHDDYLTTGYGK